MAHLIQINTFADARGSLTALGDHLPFAVRRVYYIHSVPEGVTRGGHRHKKNRQALICTSGACDVFVRKGLFRQVYTLDRRDQCLLLEPSDWHEMKNFSPESVLLVLASEPFDPSDYLNEPEE